MDYSTKMTKSYFKSLNMNSFNKEFWWGVLTTIGAWGTSFLASIGPFILIMFTLVICDTYTGIKAARKRSEKIHSRGLRRTIEKITLYSIAIILSQGLVLAFKLPVPVTYVTAFAICLTEFKSNIENIETVTEIKVWKTIKDYLPKITQNNT